MAQGVLNDPGDDALALATALVEQVGPRPYGSEAAVEAQDWVARELEARGFEVSRVKGGAAAPTTYTCRAGQTRRTVLFLAHTDSVAALGPGANDNASSVGVLLAAAARLPDDLVRTVCFAFPDGEEVGLWGSQALALVSDRTGLFAPLDQVVALELIGRGELTHHGLGGLWTAPRVRALLAAAPAAVPFVHHAVSVALPDAERSDHRPFSELGVPSSMLYARAEGGVDWAYHTHRDLPERLDRAALARGVAAVVGIASAPSLPRDKGGGPPALVLPAVPIVLPGELVPVGVVGGVGASLAALLGRSIERRAVGVGAARFAALWLVATGAFWAAVAVSAGGRDLRCALAGPVIAAGWLAWGGVVLAWPWPAPARVGRGVGASVAGALTALVAMGSPLLALPVAATGVFVAASGLLRASLRPLLVPVVAWVPLYLVRPDAVRELAFHGFLEPDPLVLSLLLAGTTPPALGLLSGRALPKAEWRPLLAAALWIGALASGLLAWKTPVEQEPYVRGVVLEAEP